MKASKTRDDQIVNAVVQGFCRFRFRLVSWARSKHERCQKSSSAKIGTCHPYPIKTALAPNCASNKVWQIGMQLSLKPDACKHQKSGGAEIGDRWGSPSICPPKQGGVKTPIFHARTLLCNSRNRYKRHKHALLVDSPLHAEKQRVSPSRRSDHPLSLQKHAGERSCYAVLGP